MSMLLTLSMLNAWAADTRCPGVAIEWTNWCPGDAISMLGQMCLFPPFMRVFGENVQRFIIYHECAHAQGIAMGRNIKANEILADRIAFERAYAEGWLDAATVGDVCKSWGKDPETDTHPSAKRRCANLRKWFAAAEGKKVAS
jgi:hypothetical protein